MGKKEPIGIGFGQQKKSVYSGEIQFKLNNFLIKNFAAINFTFSINFLIFFFDLTNQYFIRVVFYINLHGIKNHMLCKMFCFLSADINWSF